MRVLVVGSGAREHALASVLARSADVVVTPGNPGMAGRSAEGHLVSVTTAPPDQVEADFVVVGPESPLVEGLADRLRSRGTPVLGPGADGAALEGSKVFMKAIAAAAKVPTAGFAVFDRIEEAVDHLRHTAPPYVIKTDGLAAGKGVLVTGDLAEAESDVAAKLSGVAFGAAGRRVVLEEAMTGQEVSLLALCDGRRALALPVARDYKRLGDGDIGPNTGGMGAHSPVPDAPASVVDEAMASIVEPTLAELRRRGIDYRGVLYAGLMLTEDGPRLVEFNVRFGDPEAQVVLPRLAGDVAALLYAAAIGTAPDHVEVDGDAAVSVVMAAPGYPQSPRLGGRISGLDEASGLDGVSVFHAGTGTAADGSLVTTGGRVLAVSATGKTIELARRRAYDAVSMIGFEGAQYRGDIAAWLLEPVSGSQR